MIKIKDKLFFWVFVLTFILSFTVRFWQLGQLPPDLNTDEVAVGYNAWSILRTGKDEYGQKLPLFFRSFDDYKSPSYTYAIIPAMVLFGKSELAVRFPSALAGFLTVILTFLAVYELTGKKWLALASAFLLGISPWHIQYSRVALEGNLALFWIILGIWTFLKARQKGIYLLFSALSFALSAYTYHAAQLVSPLLVMLMLLLYWREFLNKKKWLTISALVGLVMIFPLLSFLQSPEGQLRPFSVSILSETQPLETFRERLQRDLILGIPFGNFWHNRRLIYLTPFIKSYLAQFRPDFLFVGDIYHHAPDVGLLYLWQIPILLIGFHALFLEKNPRTKLFIILWLIISPMAAAVAKISPSSNRSLSMVIPLQIITAYGLVLSFSSLRDVNFALGRFLKIFIVFFISLSLVYYLHMYFVHLPYELPAHWANGGSWTYGGTAAAKETKKMEGNFQKIIVSTKLDEVYIYYLFYTGYDPQTYINEGGTVSGGWNEMRNRFGKYEFHLIDSCRNSKSYGNTLLVWPVNEAQSCSKVLKTINLPNGDPAINIGIYDKNLKYE